MSPTLLLLLVVATVKAGKYVLVQSRLTWTDAQTHCRTKYTDLAPISSKYDSLIHAEVPHWHIRGVYWFGLVRNATDQTKWMWSGGAHVHQSFWKPGWSDELGKDFGVIENHSWYSLKPENTFHTFCYKVHAVRERRTWEEALQYCRAHHTDLASVASETEMMLMEKELSKGPSSDGVWIGLQFLSGQWQWVDGQPFSYESWGASLKPSCPDVSFSCGALRVSGQTATGDTLVNVERVEGWNVHDCEVRQHFLCY